MHACMQYISVYIYTHTHTHTCTHHIHMHIHIPAYAHSHIHTYIHTYTHTYIHTYIHIIHIIHTIRTIRTIHAIYIYVYRIYHTYHAYHAYHTVPYRTTPYHAVPCRTLPYHIVHTYMHTYLHTYVLPAVLSLRRKAWQNKAGSRRANSSPTAYNISGMYALLVEPPGCLDSWSRSPAAYSISTGSWLNLWVVLGLGLGRFPVRAFSMQYECSYDCRTLRKGCLRALRVRADCGTVVEKTGMWYLYTIVY